MRACWGSYVHIPQSEDYQNSEGLGFGSKILALIMLRGGVPISALEGELKSSSLPKQRRL